MRRHDGARGERAFDLDAGVVLGMAAREAGFTAFSEHVRVAAGTGKQATASAGTSTPRVWSESPNGAHLPSRCMVASRSSLGLAGYMDTQCSSVRRLCVSCSISGMTAVPTSSSVAMPVEQIIFIR